MSHAPAKMRQHLIVATQLLISAYSAHTKTEPALLPNSRSVCLEWAQYARKNIISNNVASILYHEWYKKATTGT